MTAAAWLTALAGCGSGGTVDASPAAAAPPPGQCRSLGDCTGAEQCAPTPTTSSASPRPKVVAPCMLQECASDMACGTGSVCDGGMNSVFNCFGTYCKAACTADTCNAGTQCLPNGHCVVLPCTDPEFVGCPETWYCDADAAASGDTAGGLSGEGSTSVGQAVGVLQSGCRPLRCDEPAGPSCLDGWECDTAAAGAQTVGCVALPCEEIGHCSNADIYICEPTSSNTRYDAPDPHGCVEKNCEEGLACSQYQLCDFSRADANVVGCSFIQCTEPGGVCPGGEAICDPGAENANVYGCRGANCTEGLVCPTGTHCDLPNERADSYGCVAEATDVVLKPPMGGSAGTGAGGQTATPNETGGATQTLPVDTDAAGAPPDGTNPDVTPPSDPVPDRAGGAPEGGGCGVDTDCREGYCVLGACRPELGVCSAPGG